VFVIVALVVVVIVLVLVVVVSACLLQSPPALNMDERNMYEASPGYSETECSYSLLFCHNPNDKTL